VLKTKSNEGVAALVTELVAFMTQDEDRFARFIGLTGLSLQDLRDRLSDPAFQAMVLDQALEDESWVLEFAASQNLPPDCVLKARRKLPGALY
jgi:hypothetical protein